MSMCKYVHAYTYIHTHAHTHKHTFSIHFKVLFETANRWSELKHLDPLSPLARKEPPLHLFYIFVKLIYISEDCGGDS